MRNSTLPQSRFGETIRTHREPLAFLGIYTLLYAVWNLTGGAFRVWPDLWQLLPWPALLTDLGGALYDLHSQPPLLNLLFGLALKTAVGTGATVEAVLQPFYFVLGAATVAMLGVVAGRMIHRPFMRRGALLLVIANPYFYAVHHYLFYTAVELFLLSAAALLSFRYFERPTAARLAGACAPALLLVYARSLFHPVWFVLFLLFLAALCFRAVSGQWRRYAVVSIAALLLMAAWPLKNYARFGFFGLSSWSGISLSRGLPTGEPLLPSGYPARLALFARSGPLPPDPAAVALAQSLVPPEFRGRPVLSELLKPDGSPNWNHYAVISLSRDLGAAAGEVLREHPTILFYKALDFYLNGYAIYEARWPYAQGFAPEMTTGRAWADVYEFVVFQRFRPYQPDRTTVTTSFAFWFPPLMAAAAVTLYRRRHRRGAAERTAVLMLMTILWALALVLFVDGPEGNRVRYSTSVYLFLLAGWLLGGRAERAPLNE